MTHYMEMAGIRDPSQRADIADVMEEVSGFTAILARSHIVRLEIEAALDRALSASSPHIADLKLLGHGVGHAMGMRRGLRFRSADGDVTASVRDGWPGGPADFDAWLANARRDLERASLRGPTDAEVPQLRAMGWDPTVARAIAEERAEVERQQATRLDNEPRWRRSRLRDVVQVRYLTIEIIDILTQALADRGNTIEQVFTDREASMSFAESMPSADVHVALMEAAHRNRDKSWEPNDIYDVDALSIAVPYCDLVVTERHACHVLRTARIPEGQQTEVVATPAELERWLNDQ
ncbi:hypothetical protein ACQUSR_09895 [Streptomyces sp. P1-3]|uniref:hypothetical protein n=1 Tax=Streptomyces sp. P1-3 TaxID=3421658 RepID=UPI003D36A0F6